MVLWMALFNGGSDDIGERYYYETAGDAIMAALQFCNLPVGCGNLQSIEFVERPS